MYTIQQCQQIVENMRYEEPKTQQVRNPVTVMLKLLDNIRNPSIKKEVQFHFNRIANSIVWKDPFVHKEAFYDIIDTMTNITEFTPSEMKRLQDILADR